MKILYVVTRSDEIGGAQIHVRDLAGAVQAAGHEAVVVAGGNGPLFEQLRALGVPYRRADRLVRPIRPVADTFSLYNLRRILKEESPDLVSLHSSKAGLLGRIAAKWLGIPAIFTAHGWAFTEGVRRFHRLLYAFLERIAASWAKRLITVSEYDRNLAKRMGVGRRNQVLVVHNGVPDVDPKLRASPATDPVRMVIIGRFSAQKDHQTLLRALLMVTELDWTLELIGAGPKRSGIEALAGELGLSDRVEFAGEVFDIPERLARAQIFVLASRWEGLPRSIMEAMRAGLPVVASDVGGVSELVVEGETGFLVQPGNVESLGQRLRQLLLHSELRAELGRNARLRYERHFRFERMLEETIAIYKSVIAEDSSLREGDRRRGTG